MKPQSDAASTRNQCRLFKDNGPVLSDFIDMKHPLVRMADTMQWETFESHWRTQFMTPVDRWRTRADALPAWLMLKHMEALSDERLMELWVTNPYYQYFCGELRSQHRITVNPATLVKWRKRLGEQGMEWLLTSVLESALSSGALKRESLSHLSVDSTVMEKHIAHPTDSALLEKIRCKLVALLREHALGLRGSYSREGPRLAQQIGRFAHARQFKRMRRALNRQRTWVGRLMRELQRQLDRLSDTARSDAEALLAQVSSPHQPLASRR